jgi:hypothetical protein
MATRRKTDAKTTARPRPPDQQLTLKFVTFSSPPKEQPEQQRPIAQPELSEPVSPKPYTYKPLDLGFIRIVQIHPGNDSQPLRITISHDRLDNPQLKYFALSYIGGARN